MDQMQNSLQQQPAVMFPHTCLGMSWSYPEGAVFKKVQVNLFQGNLKDVPIKTKPSYQLHAFCHCILKSLFPLTLWRPSKNMRKPLAALVLEWWWYMNCLKTHHGNWKDFYIGCRKVPSTLYHLLKLRVIYECCSL